MLGLDGVGELVQHLDTLTQILKEQLAAEDGLAIVRHVLGNPCQVEYVSEVKRQLEGRIIGVKIRPRGGTAPTIVRLGNSVDEVHFSREGRVISHASLEPRDVVSLLVATRGYGQFLPQMYSRGVQDEVSGGGAVSRADFLRRFLLIFQTLSQPVDSRVSGRDLVVDPVRMESRFLPWLASWLDFTLDERIPVTRRRIFLRRAVELFKWRGTEHGLKEVLKTLTGLEVEITPRRGPQPMELGNCALSRPDEALADATSLPFVTHAGEHLLVSPRFSREEYFTVVLENRDTLLRRYRDRIGELLEQVVRILQHERPAHLNFVICFKDEEVAHNGLVLTAAGGVTANSALGRVCLLG
ncbi:MAG: hypothetical protein CMP23_02110 [Rickettsiales bacterium]|nr:hypothetical protein [Rickettsiales bacterium]